MIDVNMVRVGRYEHRLDSIVAPFVCVYVSQYIYHISSYVYIWSKQ